MFLGWSDALFEKGLRRTMARRSSTNESWSDALFEKGLRQGYLFLIHGAIVGVMPCLKRD